VTNATLLARHTITSGTTRRGPTALRTTCVTNAHLWPRKRTRCARTCELCTVKNHMCALTVTFQPRKSTALKGTSLVNIRNILYHLMILLVLPSLRGWQDSNIDVTRIYIFMYFNLSASLLQFYYIQFGLSVPFCVCTVIFEVETM